jgi:acyl-CoA thioesterase
MQESDHLAGQVGLAMYAEDSTARYLGIELLECRAGYAEVRMTVRAEFTNGHGICHGGFQFLLADTAFAYACNSYNQRAVAASCGIDFLKAVHREQVLTAIAQVVLQGPRTGVYDVQVCNEAKEIVALMRGKSATIKGHVLEGGSI